MESCTLILNARKPNWNTGRLEHLGNPRKHAHIVTPRRKRSWMTVFFLEWPTEYHRENWVFNSERRKVPPYVKIPRVTHESKLGTHFFFTETWPDQKCTTDRFTFSRTSGTKDIQPKNCNSDRQGNAFSARQEGWQWQVMRNPKTGRVKTQFYIYYFNHILCQSKLSSEVMVLLSATKQHS